MRERVGSGALPRVVVARGRRPEGRRPEGHGPAEAEEVFGGVTLPGGFPTFLTVSAHARFLVEREEHVFVESARGPAA